MITIKTEYPFNNDSELIRHYAEDEQGNQYYILQNETQIEYAEAIDVYPCRFTYSATDKLIEENEPIVIEEIGE